MTEWRPVHGFAGLYEVSDDGQVKAVEHVVVRSNGWPCTVAEHVLSPGRIKSGHLSVRLTRPGHSRSYTVHRLVLEAFVGPAPEQREGCHIDGDPTNNHVSNLYWGTRRQNILDQVRHGVHVNARKTHCKHGHAFTPENTRVRHRPGGGRTCKTCTNNRKRAARQQKRTAA